MEPNDPLDVQAELDDALSNLDYPLHECDSAFYGLDLDGVLYRILLDLSKEVAVYPVVAKVAGKKKAQRIVAELNEIFAAARRLKEAADGR